MSLPFIVHWSQGLTLETRRMNLTIKLPDEDVQALKAKAAARGISAEEYALGVLAQGLAPSAGSFFAGSSLAELAAAQNVKPLKDISVLAGGFPEDVDIDKFLEDIYSSRK
jgi:plasmid stability protein